MLENFLKSAAARRSTFCINSVIIRCEFGKLLGFGAQLSLTQAGWEFVPFPKYRPNQDFTTHSVPTRHGARKRNFTPVPRPWTRERTARTQGQWSQSDSVSAPHAPHHQARPGARRPPPASAAAGAARGLEARSSEVEGRPPSAPSAPSSNSDVLHAQRERAPPKSGHGRLKHV